ncbi:ribosomal oxygenase 1-like [Sycon ciliatum]|uniref:ribosomal oxygenase 1-like n=1 Tax=Sycon ciliatum TaxID=27933 RepID=UPI0031F62C61
MVVPSTKSASAFSIYQEKLKNASQPSQDPTTAPATPTASKKSLKRSRSSEGNIDRSCAPEQSSKGNNELSNSLALALLKADLQVGKRKRKKSLRTQLFRRTRSSKQLDVLATPLREAPASKLKRRSLSIANRAVQAASHEIAKPKKQAISRSEKKQNGAATAAAASSNCKGFLAAHHTSPDSRDRATHMFNWLIQPVKVSNFFKTIWEEKPLLLRRREQYYYNGLFSTAELDNILRTRDLEFGVNLDVTTYQDGKRETHNPHGIAYAPVVWDFYQSGCSVRLLNPQTFSDPVWRLCSTLQEYFGCFVGANIYLTPPGSQGFAPHYDDIEAFVLQLEGKKHWRLYKPRSQEETLPRFSSPNFSQDEIGEPILDVTLSPGDMLYFPRGTIHQADTPGDSHSLHMTVSTCQKNTWGDLLQKVLPQMLESAIEHDVDFRKSLPVNYIHHLGTTHSESTTSKRASMIQQMGNLVDKLKDHLMADEGADEMAADFLHAALPPYLDTEDKNCTAVESGGRWESGCVMDHEQVDLNTEIRLVSHIALRLTPGDDCLVVCTTVHNSRVYKQKDPQTLELDLEYAEALEYLQDQYPEFVTVENLPAETDDAKLELAAVLYRSGLVMTERPLGGTADYV